MVKQKISSVRLTNDEIGLLSTDELVARDIRNYGNTVPEGSFGSGSLSNHTG